MGEFMRMILLAGLALATAACGGGDREATDANTMATDNMMMDSNVMMDGNVMMDANGAMMDGTGAMNGAGAMGGNGAMDAGTQNAMMKDAQTNDPDTNLANGM
jgi:hypothetical protein